MSLKTYLKSDLDAFFDLDEFAQEVTYTLGAVSAKVTVQFFDDDSKMGDSTFKKMVFPKDAIPNISKEGFFLIDTKKYGIIDYESDEEGLLMQVLLQKGMR